MPKYELKGRKIDTADAASAFGAYFRQLANISSGLELLRSLAANNETKDAIDDLDKSVTHARSKSLELYKELAPQYSDEKELN